MQVLSRTDQTKKKRQLVRFLVKERKKREVSLRRFATHARLGFGHLSDIENGKIDPSWPALAAISQALDMSMADAIESTFSLPRNARQRLEFVCSLLVRSR